MRIKHKIFSILLTSLLLFEVVFASSWNSVNLSNSADNNSSISNWQNTNSWEVIKNNKKNIKSDNSSFLWIKKSRSATILDNFKDSQKEILFENVPISSRDEELIFNSDSKLRTLEDILSRIENRKETLKDRKKVITRNKYDLKSALAALDKDIEETIEFIKDAQKKIADKNIEIEELAKKITDLDEKIASNKKVILNYLAYIYSKWDSMYSQDNEIDLLRSIILNDEDIWKLLNDMHSKTLIELSGQNLIDIHREMIKEFYYSKESLKQQKLEQVILKWKLNAKNQDLANQKEYKEELLQVTKWKEAIYNRLIIQKQERESDVKEKIENVTAWYNDVFDNIWSKYNCDIKYSTWWLLASWSLNIEDQNKKCNEIKQYFALEKKLREDSKWSMEWVNPLSWPSPPTRWLSTYFYDEWYFEALGSEHEAIDIKYYQWTELKAPADWYVYFINPPVKWWYSYLALKHSNWFITVYWHLSEVLVNQFDFVEAWQIFAKSWWAPGTPWAWPMTSWPHLHFEVYKDRQNIDPFRFLDLTNLAFEELPSKYRYKYIEDLKIRYWNKANLSRYQKFYIAWESEIDRQKYLLSKYASADFNNWDMWIEESVNAKIDPSFLICVWVAESWLGKHLKTWYNVGNIGNTDSGWTYTFDNAREWVYRMNKTLNNRYLSKYKSVDMLSRRWNKDGSIYASSSKNWHNNVIKCLSGLKWRFIEDDYKFRLNDSTD